MKNISKLHSYLYKDGKAYVYIYGACSGITQILWLIGTSQAKLFAAYRKAFVAAQVRHHGHHFELFSSVNAFTELSAGRRGRDPSLREMPRPGHPRSSERPCYMHP